MRYLTFLVFLAAFVAGCRSAALVQPAATVMTGADRLVADYFELLAGRNVGVITNHTALVGIGTSWI